VLNVNICPTAPAVAKSAIGKKGDIEKNVKKNGLGKLFSFMLRIQLDLTFVYSREWLAREAESRIPPRARSSRLRNSS
jgi:hypothetical protein